eukprot:TRINITY_DN11637_c0_g1_i1.p1 TRINITY_DN11637_c0_g1~~TRINITY_DN11637_c0_g1_i1.p1  ORF type:complete len:461 (+),score=122.29 TRINITY_DN11637_c0_g1_i1:136-1383(+)
MAAGMSLRPPHSRHRLYADCQRLIEYWGRSRPMQKGLPVWLPPHSKLLPGGAVSSWVEYWERRGDVGERATAAAAAEEDPRARRVWFRLARAARAVAGDSLHVPLTMQWAIPRLVPDLTPCMIGGLLSLRVDVIGAETEHLGPAKYLDLLSSLAAGPAMLEVVFCGPELPEAAHGACDVASAGTAGAVALVQSVDPSSPAEEADLKAGDMLLEVAGMPPSPHILEAVRAAAQQSAEHGVPLDLRLLREGKEVYRKIQPARGQPLGASLIPLPHCASRGAPRVVVARCFRGKYEEYAVRVPTPPHAAFAFNSGVADFAEDWLPAIQTGIVERGVPACFTSYHAEEARLDADTLRLRAGCPVMAGSPMANPFASPLSIPDDIRPGRLYRASEYVTLIAGAQPQLRKVKRRRVGYATR